MLEFRVIGNPAPQGSKVNIPPRKFGGKPGLFEQSSRLGLWRLDVQNAALEAIKEKPRHSIPPVGPWFKEDEPLILEVEFRMRRPKKPKSEHHITAPDLSKLLRAVEDAMEFIIYKDDRQIVGYVNSRKRYATEAEVPGATIKIKEAD